jgi:hypothetical protein
MNVDAREALLARYKWQRIVAPRSWRPREIGEQLVGFYGGKTTRRGTYGSYEAAIVHVPGEGAYLVSGVVVINLLDTALVAEGSPIRIVWGGSKPLSGERTCKQFELYVAEGEPLAATDLPIVEG